MKPSQISIAIVAFVAAFFLPATRADCPLEASGYWGGVVNGLTHHDGLLYAAIGRRLQVIDASNPSVPTPVGDLEFAGPVWQIGIDGAFAYLVSRATLYVVNVSDPTTPHAVGSLDIGESPFSSAVMRPGDPYIFATTGYPATTLIVIDIVTPESPRVAAFLDMPDGSAGLAAVHESHLYGLRSDGGMHVFDVTSPQLPILAGEVFAGQTVRRLDFGGQTPVAAIDGLGLVTLDLSAPLAPRILGQSAEFGTIAHLRAEGTRVLVRQDPNAGDLGIFSIVDPAMPTLLVRRAHAMHYGDFGFGQSSIVVTDLYGNLAFYGNPLPGVLYPAARYFEAGKVGEELAVDGPNIVAIAGDTLKIIRMETEGPTLLGVYEIPPFTIAGFTSPDLATSVFAWSGYAYLTTLYRGLLILDISDPAQPHVVQQIDDEIWVKHVRDNLAYAVGNGFSVFDVSDPTAPRLLGNTPVTVDGYTFVDIDGPLACVLNYHFLTVLDISDPFLPRVTATVPINDYIFGVALHGRTAYVAKNNESLKIFDLTDPAQPVAHRTFGDFGHVHAFSVAVHGNLLYASMYGDLWVGDLSEPLEPSLLARHDGQQFFMWPLKFTHDEVVSSGGYGIHTAEQFAAGDIDGDRDVDLADLGLLMSLFGQFVGGGPGNGDFNCDGWVDLSDLTTLLSTFGTRQ